MKFYKLTPLALLLVVLTFSSCEKRKIKECVDEMTGSFTSLTDCYGDTDYAGYFGLSILKGDADEEININLNGYFTFVGVVDDENCNFVIPPVEVYAYQSYDYSYSNTISGQGAFDKESNTITLNLTINYIYNGVPEEEYSCNLSFVKL